MFFIVALVLTGVEPFVGTPLLLIGLVWAIILGVRDSVERSERQRRLSAPCSTGECELYANHYPANLHMKSVENGVFQWYDPPLVDSEGNTVTHPPQGLLRSRDSDGS